MLLRTALCLALGLASTAALAGKPSLSLDELFHGLRPISGDLARYDYLQRALPRLAPDDRTIAMQLMAGTENELGMYSEAIQGFPLKPRLPAGLALPQAADWRVADAAEVVARLAAGRRLVLLNEAHHDAHTRELTLALLPRLRALGFTHFAAEALGDHDPQLAQRGYPTGASGSEYLREPLYGEIVREAIRLGFVLVPYDGDTPDTAAREQEQARNLYRRVFKPHPDARLVVHAGYAHIDKASGRLGGVRPMATQLAELSGIEPLSVDQVDFRDVHSGNAYDAYHQLIAAFQPRRPAVLLSGADGKPWSAAPGQYDVSVILPPGLPIPAPGRTEDAEHTAWLSFGLSGIPVQPPESRLARPDWLALDGRRQPYPVAATLCRRQFPCLVEAHYANESGQATAADRYLFLRAGETAALYLFPGRYRLRAATQDDRTLHEQDLAIAGTAPAAAPLSRP